MAEAAKPAGRIRGWFKALMAAVVGLVGGSIATYGTAVVNSVVHPTKPVANFATSTDGLTVTCQNRATGESGWWDFGDGSPLEPFDAGKQSIDHTYSKPGSYQVKLTVRNFLAEENERTVPVDLTAAPQALPPSVAVKVEPIGPRAVAPATFRVKGEAKNVEKALLDLGERVEVSAESGPFERLVVFEKPGNYPIQLLGYSGKQAVKDGATVRVESPAAGDLSVVVRVADTGTRLDRREEKPVVTVPVPKTAEKGFTKVLAARPGYTVTAAKLNGAAPPAVRNVTVAPTVDKKGVQVTGEWATAQKAGGSDVMIPVVMTEERTAPMTGPPATVSALLKPGAGEYVATIAMPPRPLNMTDPQRRLTVEIFQATADGRFAKLMSVSDPKLPLNTKLGTLPNPVTVEQVGEQLKVSVR